ncbi:probable ATP-dependent RNA helicase DDX4 isoform X2 [Brienomyrus brachyistius]|uniref:probable ATP-dependent RNA helicase DDX4 isoform X2 n=1 Tax=Brienomyrus brachyistius TaxID=42636 RepID=UPI0020B1D647|nr:probable ATP-dependent RNA helicase DDX4 isoform X2 [Brienomyrus brachyistius]
MEDWEEDNQDTSGGNIVNNAPISSWNSGDYQSKSHRNLNGSESSSWNSSGGSFGGSGRGSGRGSMGGGGGYKGSSTSDNGKFFGGKGPQVYNEDSCDGDGENNGNEDSSWGGAPGGYGGRARGRGGRGSRGGSRGGFSNTSSGTGEFGNEDGFRSDFGGRGGRGRGGFRQGYRGRDEEVFSDAKDSSESKGPQDGENAGPKVIYIPPPPPEEESSIFAHYETGINFNKYDDILVEVSGHNPPPAIVSFEEAGLCESLSRNVMKSGYVKPTPVQKYGIPITKAGRDLMACAQTGSGKTAAFLLPILQQLMTDGVAATRFSEIQEPEVIIVAPTRELINQIYLEARKFAYGTCVRPVVVYGGISTGYTIREVLRGCNVLCGTPGRLLDIIGKGKVGLSKIRYLVLDEADRMLDMGFEPDMRRLVSSPGMPPKEQRQTLMFSATFPDDIQKLAADFLKVDYLFLAVGQVGGACSDVEQILIQVSQFSKRDQLVELLNTTGTERTMVFVETKRKADFIATFLCQENISTTSIHGDREQREREQALGDFRSGKCPVLVATSVAARGLDIEHVQHVVNFDLPTSIDEYVHRIGRTGRCGNTGRAVSFFDPECDTPLARSLVKVLSGAQQEVPSWLEDVAFSAHGTTGFNPRGKVFASVDTRKGGSFQKEEKLQPVTQSPAAAADADEEWE